MQSNKKMVLSGRGDTALDFLRPDLRLVAVS